MRIINVTPKMDELLLGRLGENERTQFVFDVSDWLEEYPGATIGLANQLPHTKDSYACTITSEGGGKYSWTITSAELTTEGDGKCQLQATSSGVVVKGKIYKTKIGEALDGEADPPDPWESWITDLTEIKEAAEDAAEDAEDAKDAVQNLGVAAITLLPGTSATVTKTVDPVTGAVTLTFGIPKGLPGNETIDDTAGAGDTDKVWSANKEVTEFNKKLDKINPVVTGRLESEGGRKSGTANGDRSIAYGSNNEASGKFSRAYGSGAIAAGSYQMAVGRYNVKDIFPEWAANTHYYVGDPVFRTTQDPEFGELIELYWCNTENTDASFTSSKWTRDTNWEKTSKYIEIIGNGTADNARSNARVLDWDGNERLKGDLYVECNSDSTGGKKVLVEPASEGTSGQVLTTDGEGGRTWTTVQGGGGTSDYDDLSDKPQINGTTLSGNKTGANLGLLDAPSTAGTSGQVLVSDGNGGQVWGTTGSGTITVDNTLSVPGAAADSKVCGDNIAILNNETNKLQQQIPVNEENLYKKSEQTNVKLQDTGLRTSDSNNKIVAYPVVAGTVVEVTTGHMWQFQTQETVPSSGTAKRVGETHGAGTTKAIVPETATFLNISTANDGTYGAKIIYYDFSDQYGNVEDVLDDVGFVIENQAYPKNTNTYTADYGSVSLSGRTLQLTAIGSGYGGSASSTGRYFDDFDVSANDKVYLYGKMNVNATGCSRIRLSYCGVDIENTSVAKDTVYTLSNVITCSNITNKNRIVFYEAYSEKSYATDAILTVEDLILVNLTKAFGSGNEPDKTTMDTLVSERGWFTELNLLRGQETIQNIKTLQTNTNKLVGNAYIDITNYHQYNSPTSPNDGTEYASNSSGTSVSTSTSISGNNGDVFYAWGQGKAVSTENCASISAYSNNGRPGESTTIENPDNDTWYPLSVRFEKTSNTGGSTAWFVGSWASAANIKFYYKHIVALNLTAIFGKYNEPSKAMLDNYFYQVSENGEFDFKSASTVMLNLGCLSGKISYPSGNYVLLDEEGNVKMGSVPDPQWSGWSDIGTYGQTNVASIPIYNKVHGTLETDGMISVLPLWGCWSQNASSGNAHHGGHVFHGWTTDRQHRLTMVQNIYRDDEAAVFNYIPGDKSGTSEGVFLRLRLGADNNYKGVLIENEYGGSNNTDYHMARMTVYGRLNIAKHSNFNNIPASASADGVKGDICVDGNYIYVCTDTDTWKRIPLQAWT